MHFFGFAVGDEAGSAMAAGNRSAIPVESVLIQPGRAPHLQRAAVCKMNSLRETAGN